MASTLEERLTIWRLRHIHDTTPKKISAIFPHIPYPTVRRICSQWEPDTISETDQRPTKTTVDRKKDNIEFLATIPLANPTVKTDRVQTLDNLIEATGIDTERWKIDRWIANTWENVMKGADFEPIITTLFQIKAYLSPNEKALSTLILQSLRDEIRDGSPPIVPLSSPQDKDLPPASGQLLEISIPDMHFGKLALAAETGQEYNLDIAEQLYRSAVERLLTAALANGQSPDEILLPLGNDLFNVDNQYLTTFAHTPQENSHSVKALYRRVKNILRDVITGLALVAPVRILMVPGNHDRTISYFLGETLEDIFWNSENVTVINSPKKHQFYSWGTVLLGFTHGDKIRKDDLPILMINEVPELFAKTSWREWHLGHKHTKKDTDFSTPLSTHKGVIVRELPSLTAADNWHADRAFKMNNRSAEAYLWDSKTGLAATYHTNILNKN